MPQQVDLFGVLDAPVKPEREPTWRLIPHVCRFCHGRLLSRRVGRRVITRCAKCGSEIDAEHEALCCCGIVVAGFDRPFMCVENPRKSAEFPAEIAVMERPWNPGERQFKQRRPVYVPDDDLVEHSKDE